MTDFQLITDLTPKGDQPQAIEKIVESVGSGEEYTTLLGITGSGKTFTMANVIARLNRPTLVISHNKTLAAQLYAEFKDFFPKNAVEYFVSYYDYYQPEAYIPQTDTYIDKETSVSDELERMRLSTTASLLTRRDTLVVSSVSCIYGLGDPAEVRELNLLLSPEQKIGRDEMIRSLIDMQYERSQIDVTRGTFRVKGDTIDIALSGETEVYRIELWGDAIERISLLDPVRRTIVDELASLYIYPAKHFVATQERIDRAIKAIQEELVTHLEKLRSEDKLLEAQRVEQRTKFDLEMLQEAGYCQGIENYSLHFSDRKWGEPPSTLIDYFPDDLLVIIDESHATLPQIRGMYFGDRSRKDVLVEYGFRLPSAKENRPLQFDEFNDKIDQVLYTSATPGPFENEHSKTVIEQVIRPTGLLDPEIIVRPVEGQVDDLLERIRVVVAREERVLVTTLTKRMAEDLADHYTSLDVRVRYLHSEIDTLDRLDILRDLQLGHFDVLIGINLLREGLDLPQVSLVAILDADQEGFLRSETSLIQTIGRASRNVRGTVIMYADNPTGSMERAIKVTTERRKLQQDFNDEHNIVPQTIMKAIRDYGRGFGEMASITADGLDDEELPLLLEDLEREMNEAAEHLEFERAALIRDKIKELQKTAT